MTKSAIANLVVAGALAAMTPSAARANLFVEMSFGEKIASSDLVIVGTVTSLTRGRPGRYDDGFASISVVMTLKGQERPLVVVLTKSRIAEENPECCELGATYMMFLEKAAGGPQLRSVNGRFGVIKLGPARRDPQIEILRN